MTLFEDRIRHDLMKYEHLEHIDINITENLNLLIKYCDPRNKNILKENLLFEMKFAVVVNSGLYKSYKLDCALQFNKDYPFEGPKLKCFTSIQHPNIWETHVCMSILRESWTPANDISIILYTFYILIDVDERDLLDNINYRNLFIKNALNTEIAELIKNNPKQFINSVKAQRLQISKN
ncbi:NEDD8-conjugating enzyme Ubc12 [Cucumispora dikerogammari]|nr:NEDD8-conjugating enzyme Ubc12 [Cucumispora dikerogammari]